MSHFVEKPGGKDVRMVTDYTQANKHIMRAVHGFSTVSEVRNSISSTARYFCVLDLCMGYYQLRLHEDSQDFTTFAVSVGSGTVRYKYLSEPMGMSCTNNEFCSQTDQAFEGIPETHKVVDDILISGATKQKCLERVKQVLGRAREHGISIYRKKVQFGSAVSYGGFLIRVKNDRVVFLSSPELMDAIRHYPVPKRFDIIKGIFGSFAADH